jgi:hypothetical protein
VGAISTCFQMTSASSAEGDGVFSGSMCKRRSLCSMCESSPAGGSSVNQTNKLVFACLFVPSACMDRSSLYELHDVYS